MSDDPNADLNAATSDDVEADGNTITEDDELAEESADHAPRSATSQNESE